MISARVDSADATEALRQLKQRIEKETAKTIGRLTLNLLTKVKRDKLSGQVLNVRTGRLRRSINQKVTTVDGLVIGTVGTNVEYAAVHEYGFKGAVSVKEHLRTIKMAWGVPIPPQRITVSAHNRNMNLPMRSFLRSALSDMDAEIMTELRASVGRAIA
ncbi:MAG: hypothetical protein RLY58_2310 [Pseudomonadota bacterium]|jgi:phage gpG-like protein